MKLIDLHKKVFFDRKLKKEKSMKARDVGSDIQVSNIKAYENLKKWSVFLAISLIWVLAISFLSAGFAEADTFTVSSGSVDFCVNDGSFYVKSSQIPAGASSPGLNASSSISGSNFHLTASGPGYSDAGIVLYFSGGLQLGDIESVSVAGTGGPLSINLWLDTSGDGQFFTFDTSGQLTGLNGDSYSSSSGTHFDANSSVYMQGGNGAGNTYTLAQLQAGVVPGIDGNTPVAIWIGITNSGGAPADISRVTVQAPFVQAGYIQGAVLNAGVRYKSLNNGTTREIYLGKPDLGIGTNRVEIDAVWTGSNNIRFTYDPAAGNLQTHVQTGANGYDLTYPIGDLNDLNYMQIDVINRAAGTTVELNNVTLKTIGLDGIASGDTPLGNFPAPSLNSLSWMVTGADLSNGFEIQGELVLSGPQPNGETNKVEILVGHYDDANIQVTPVSPVDLGSVNVGSSSAAKTLTISNTGDVGLAIGQIGTSNPEFAIRNDMCSNQTVMSLGTCTVDVILTPAASGTRTANMNIMSNDPDTPDLVISLIGAGLQTTAAITATAGSGGSISPSGSVSVMPGTNQAFFITAGSGYSIAQVMVDGVSKGTVGSYTFTNISAGTHTISATFNPTITASAGPNGSISPLGTAAVISGGSKTYTIRPTAGYHVADIQVDGVSLVLPQLAGNRSHTYTFTNVTTPHTIAVTFTENPPATITASAGSNGSISPSGSVTVLSGTNKTFSITPNAGYSIAQVMVDGISKGMVSSYTFINITAGTHTISATFNPTITATAGPNGSISPVGTAAVTSGGSKTYIIRPTVGYHIANVLVDGISAGTVATYTFTGVTTPHTISATFAQN